MTTVVEPIEVAVPQPVTARRAGPTGAGSGRGPAGRARRVPDGG